jgi:hypothetical protein
MTYLNVQTQYTPRIYINDVIAHIQDQTQLTCNTGFAQVGFVTDSIGINAVMSSVPGITSTLLPNAIPLGDKAIVLDLGPGRKFIIGHIDQTYKTIPCSPGETAVYGTSCYTKYALTGIENHATTADSINFTANHPAGLSWDSTTDPSIIDAYNDLAAKYQLLLDTLSNLSYLVPGSTVPVPVFDPTSATYNSPKGLVGLNTDATFILKYNKL